MGKYRRNYKTDLIVVGWDNADLTYQCIQSVKDNTPQEAYQITYIDNGSEPQPVDYWVRNKFPEINFVRLPFNHGFIRGTNIGMAMSLLTDSEYVLLLNNDTEIPKGDKHWLDNMIALMSDKAVGAVGAVSDNVSGYQRRTGHEITFTRTLVPALIGFCMLLRKKAIEQVGLLDERFEPGNFDDIDFSLRLTKAGWKLAVAESVFIHHAMHASFKALNVTEPFGTLLETNKQKLADKWGEPALKQVGL